MHSFLAKQALLLTAALIPLSVWAAGTATIETEGEPNTITWIDQNTVRIDMPMADNSYMLARDGKIYMVSTEITGGTPTVMEIGGLMQGAAEMFDDDSTAQHLKMDIASVKATSAKETVAGIEGQIYELQSTDDNGKKETMQAVFTDHPLAIEMTDTYVAFLETMMGTDNVAEFKNSMPKDKRGLLRIGDTMIVTSISGESPAAESFELPAKPIDMGEMIRQMMQQ